MAGYLWLVVLAVLAAVVAFRFRNDWRSYLAIAGAILSGVVARRDDIDRWLGAVPEGVYKAFFLVGGTFLVVGLLFLLLDLQRKPVQHPPRARTPRSATRSSGSTRLGVGTRGSL
jgi:hypothetical protein